MPGSSDHIRPPGPVIACVGEVLIDLISTPTSDWSRIEQFVPRIGGAPANAAVALRRLGGQSVFIGGLASDAPGQWIRQRLVAEQIDISGSPVLPDAQTRLAAVTGPIDDRSFDFYGSPAADSLLTPEHINASSLAQSAAIMLGGLLLLTEPGRSSLREVLDLADRHDIPIVFDPNPRPSLWPDPRVARDRMMPFIEKARILKLGVDEPSILGLTVDQIRAHQPEDSVLVLTDGARGCWYWYGDAGVRHVPSIPVTAVDSTGAGDAFNAALTLRMVERGQALDDDDLHFASAVGALATTREGAMDALPWRETVERALAENR
jgi:fructokinase